MKTIIIALGAAIIILGGYYWYTQSNRTETSNMTNGEVIEETDAETDVAEEMPATGKLDINVVCDSALAYMTFPDGESADQFVAECVAGDHPEVIERFKADMNLGADVAI